jgi:sugar (pentulose or hexulose) kinase
MPLVLSLDLGTTTITALALDVAGGEIVARETAANAARIAADGSPPGRSEWEADRIAADALAVLRRLTASLGKRTQELAGIGLTGQQHGVVLVDRTLNPQGPFINWQDRRTEELDPQSGRSWLALARDRAGHESRRMTGCTLAAGYMGATLFWLQGQGLPLRERTACFLVDFMAARLTGESVATDATSAASSGLFDVRSGAWYEPLIEALALPIELFPQVREGGRPHGQLSPQVAEATGLPAGLPVCVGVGDNQASVYGSVAELEASVLVNVGTGGQVAAFSDRFLYGERLETRPFPGGFLLVSAGLCGGRTYALLEQFFRQVCGLPGEAPPDSMFETMNRLAAGVPRGADGLCCNPLFTGTRSQPELRGSFEGISVDNFTPAHVTRALLEGMARVFAGGAREIEAVEGKPRRQLVGAGNGLRENPVLADCVAHEFALPLAVPRHREEAAFGAALLAAVGLGAIAGRQAAAQLIRYECVGSPGA